MTYNSLISKRFATYQFNIAFLDNCTNVSLNTKEIKHYCQHQNSHIHVKTGDMSCFLLIHTWVITYCMFQEIHHHILKVFIKDTNLYFLTMWVFCKGLHINNQKQNNQNWNIPYIHSILDSLCCPLSLCGMSWLPLATERNIIMNYGAHTVRYSLVF